MHPLSNNQILSNLHKESGMSFHEFADVLDVRYNSLTEFFTGARPVPEGIISDAHQILEDIAFWEAKLRAMVDGSPIHYAILKKALANISKL